MNDLIEVDFVLRGAGRDARGVPFHARGYYGEGFVGRPYQPTLASGITLDWGYDLSGHTFARLLIDWLKHIGTSACNRLLPAIGVTGTEAKQWLGRVRDIKWTQAQADEVFDRSLLPRYAAAVDGWAPGWRDLPIGTRTALFSLAYNRGILTRKDWSTVPSRRDEMTLIPAMVAEGNLPAIAGLIRAMKGYWTENQAKDDDALAARRECEALLIETDYPKDAAA